MKCAMYLFLGYLDGAAQFAQSCGPALRNLGPG